MKKIFITTAALLIACTLSAADLFVSPEGNDRNPGTKDSPKATLTAALRQARELRRLNDESVKGGITIHLEAGDYHLYEPVFIRPEDSGTDRTPDNSGARNSVLLVSVFLEMRMPGWKMIFSYSMLSCMYCSMLCSLPGRISAMVPSVTT